MENSIGVVKRILPPHMVASQLKILIPVGMATSIVESVKKALADERHADREHVMRPDAHADERDAHGRRHHRRIAEDGFAREHGDDFVGEGKCGKHQDIDLGMPEDPEEMHPQQRDPPACVSKKWAPR